MRLNRKLQYGLLFVIYLHRSGRATIDAVSQNMKVPKDFLEQIARQLRLNGIIKSIRGPAGGYELDKADVTVANVFTALNGASHLTPQEMSGYRRGPFEHRALFRTVQDITFSLSPVFNRKIKDIVREVVAAELYLVNQAQPSMRPN
jgi:Rrf2 family iron-sulfur cluster assembly transcriptional regulator